MFVLIISILIGAAVTYGIFFLLLKLLWMLLKKTGNKWPLILSGIFTGVIWGAIIITIYMFISALMAPFKGIAEEIAKNPTPVYGQHVYQDTAYPVELEVFDGMNFSDWMIFDKTAVKVGVDTNIFKDKNNKKHPFTAIVLVRDSATNKGEQATFAKTEKLLQEAQQQRRMQVTHTQSVMLEGKPAYFATGTLATNNGLADVAAVTLYNGTEEIYYVVAFSLGENQDLAKLEQTVKSIRTAP